MKWKPVKFIFICIAMEEEKYDIQIFDRPQKNIVSTSDTDNNIKVEIE